MFSIDMKHLLGWEWKTFGDGKVQPKHKGKITNGKPNGFGVLTYPDGKKYVGEHKNGLPNGQGTFTFTSGNIYVGVFKDGILNGQGTFTSPKGQ